MLPDWEVLPYDVFSPHAEIVSDRLLTLAELPQLLRRGGVLLVTADTLMQRLPPRAYVAGHLPRGGRDAGARGLPHASWKPATRA
ncbi:MAG: hypothetical protein U1F11_09355 [Steroidobacteraceae bacterium]